MIYCGIASLPEREANLRLTIKSLIDQVDVMFLALNGYDSVPNWVNREPKIKHDLLDNSLGDSAKFLHVGECDGYYLTLDDDLAVQHKYVGYMCDGAQKYKGLTSLHGRIYLKPVINFKRWVGNYRCLNTVSEDVHVNLIGSGCSCHHTDRLKLSISDFKTAGKADVWLSKVATEQGVPMVVLKHTLGDVRYLPVRKGTTIWESTKDYSEHIQIMRTFIK
jgi:hypothetical protein